MNKLFQRLLIFFVGLPLLIGLIMFNQFHHIAVHVLLICACLLGSDELLKLFSNKFSLQPRGLVLVMSIVPSIVGAVCAIFNLKLSFIDYSFIAAVMVCMAYEVLTAKSFENSVSHLLTSTFVLLYAGFLLTFISRITMHEEYSREFISIFVLMVCMCDSIAWLFGNLFGKNNKGFIKASPNKSIAGFIGGFVGSILSGYIGYKVFPEVFHGSILKILILGFFIALVAIVGDLVESVIKRSVEIKDSGNLIPGRGGVLDSIDSIIFAAPVYYFGINFLYLTSVTN